jgi:hypothetical protein
MKIGDRVRCIDAEAQYGYGPQLGDEVIITAIDQYYVGYVNDYPNVSENHRSGKETGWFKERFVVIEDYIEEPLPPHPLTESFFNELITRIQGG